MKMETIADILGRRLKGKAAIVGIGSRDCADDGAGPFIVEKLTGSSDLSAIDAGDFPELFLDRIREESPGSVMFIDSADFGSEPGSVAVIEREQLSDGWGNGHQPPLSAIMAYLARICDADVFLLGIQPEEIREGYAMSPPVSSTVEIIAELINHFALKSRKGCKVQRI